MLRRPLSAMAVEHDKARPTKRIRLAEDVNSEDVERLSRPPAPVWTVHQLHPLLLKPPGNTLLNPARAAAYRYDGPGALGRLSDALVLKLLAHLPATGFARV
jgi:hypothetical protein